MFDTSRYRTDFVTFNTDFYKSGYDTASGNITYFVLKDREGKSYGEARLSVFVKPNPIDAEIYLNLINRVYVNPKNDLDEKILSAYDYVSKKYEGKIIVSDTFEDIDIVNFAEEISKKRSKKMSLVLESLTKVRESNKYVKKNYPISKLLKKRSKKGDLKMFFLEPKDNYVMVVVFKAEKNSNYSELTTFGSSDVYLFRLQLEII